MNNNTTSELSQNSDKIEKEIFEKFRRIAQMIHKRQAKMKSQTRRDRFGIRLVDTKAIQK